MTNHFSSFGIGFGQPLRSAELAALGVLAEKLGFKTFWIQEGYRASAIAQCACVLLETRRLDVGTGITSPFRRRPDALALDALTLDEISEGRFILGLGAATGYLEATELASLKPFSAMNEAIDIIRGLLTESSFTYDGSVFKVKKPMSLGSKPKRVHRAIYVGAMGDRMVRLTGQKADGLVISRRAGFSVEYVKHAVELLRQGANRGNRRPEELDVHAFFEMAVSKKSEEARAFIKRILGTYTIPLAPDPILKTAGVTDEEIQAVRSHFLKGDMTKAAESVSDELVQKVAVAGTPDECVERLSEYLETGLKSPICYIHGPDSKEAAKLIATKVMPNLTGK